MGTINNLVVRAQISMYILLAIGCIGIPASLKDQPENRLFAYVERAVNDLIAIRNEAFRLRDTINGLVAEPLLANSSHEDDESGQPRMSKESQQLEEEFSELMQDMEYQFGGLGPTLRTLNDPMKLTLNDLQQFSKMTPPKSADRFVEILTQQTVAEMKRGDARPAEDSDATMLNPTEEQLRKVSERLKIVSILQHFITKWRDTVRSLPVDDITSFYEDASADQGEQIGRVLRKIQTAVPIPIIGQNFGISTAIVLLCLAAAAVLFDLHTVASSMVSTAKFCQKGEGLHWVFFYPSRNRMGMILGVIWLALPFFAATIATCREVITLWVGLSLCVLLFVLVSLVSYTVYQARIAIHKHAL